MVNTHCRFHLCEPRVLCPLYWAVDKVPFACKDVQMPSNNDLMRCNVDGCGDISYIAGDPTTPSYKTS